ncbi:hypothetical protein QVD17_16320 [Tagetes erecta]|uniref:BHLH domain-containing protein n=1 Tax=Tagetes erecta TaxID=13708 RepID=A0AAD8KRX7_TARER|nr:hypothetical protein QVD17_16320 [Tagetes erecta]
MMRKCDNGSKNIDRKTVEKNRRSEMKKLCFKLNSLVPSLISQPFKSITYIEQLKDKVEVLKVKRDKALSIVNVGGKNNMSCNVKDDESTLSREGTFPLSTVEVQEIDGGLKVLLITGLEGKVLFSEVISIVEDGGAEVIKAGYTTIGDKVIYTLHAMAPERRASGGCPPRPMQGPPIPNLPRLRMHYLTPSDLVQDCNYSPKSFSTHQSHNTTLCGLGGARDRYAPFARIEHSLASSSCFSTVASDTCTTLFS